MSKVRTDSIIAQYTDTKRCYYTGYEGDGIDLHHIFNGPRRKWSDKNGCWIYIRHDLHMKLHQRKAKELIRLKRIAQLRWEEVHRDEYEDVRAEFMKQVGKNYDV